VFPSTVAPLFILFINDGWLHSLPTLRFSFTPSSGGQTEIQIFLGRNKFYGNVKRICSLNSNIKLFGQKLENKTFFRQIA
jgi:hypothetical protein